MGAKGPSNLDAIWHSSRTSGAFALRDARGRSVGPIPQTCLRTDLIAGRLRASTAGIMGNTFYNAVMVSSCLIAIVLFAQLPDTSAALKLPHEFPPVIALLLPSSENKPVLVPLGIYEAKTWSLARLTPMVPKEANKKPEPTTPEDKAFVDALLREQFYASYDHSILFIPGEPVAFDMFPAAFHFGLAGELHAKQSSWNKDEFLVMTNRGKRLAKPRPLEHLENEASLAVLVIKAMADREAEFKKSNEKCNPALYQTPELEEAAKFDLAENRTAVFLHMVRLYPKDAAPTDADEPEFPMWQGDYCAVCEVVHGRNYLPLWEDVVIENQPIDDERTYILLGACDGDGDGVSEVAIEKRGHEYLEFKLLALSGKRFVEVSSIYVGP